MEKRKILAVAGAGKTTFIVDRLSADKRSLVVTYSNSNYDNLSRKISSKYEGNWPDNIRLMTYFQFLYQFCYKPLLADKIKAKGVIFKHNENNHIPQSNINYYMTKSGYFYSDRLAFFMGWENITGDIIHRIEKYFDEFIIDEVQDIGGRDFNFLKELMSAKVNMLFVGDFYQHTYDTSRDGNVNKNLYNNYRKYKNNFSEQGFIVDTLTLKNSWRCSKNICKFVSENLGISIESNRDEVDNSSIEYISDKNRTQEIIADPSVIKLHYQNAHKYGIGHKNWGDSKGEDCYQDVCVVLNKTTFDKYISGNLNELNPLTRNKLYVAITRAHGNCFLIEDYKVL